eukprot:5041403-Alexandrium_andersonii.AAC.1
MSASLVGSEMCIRDRRNPARPRQQNGRRSRGTRARKGPRPKLPGGAFCAGFRADSAGLGRPRARAPRSS